MVGVNNISTSQLREIPEEIKKWSNISFLGTEVYIGNFTRDENLFIVSDWPSQEFVSMSILISKNLSNEEKLKILKNLIKILMNLEALGDGFAHGHLCPNNVLIQKDFEKVLITDFGFHSLKAYCSMLIDYSNKDHYTAPELLTQKGKTIKKPTHKGDIYSLSFILL